MVITLSLNLSKQGFSKIHFDKIGNKNIRQLRINHAFVICSNEIQGLMRYIVGIHWKSLAIYINLS